jgi:lipopolysaccharide/colanic/teichoic acid biosynthesis glycosyltransferase
LYEVVKRGFDVAAASAGLAVLWPALLGIAAVIRIDSPGPALYRGVRTGLHGQPFHILKFRTMRVGAEASGTTTEMNDPRITRVGAFLRKYKLDELPQLINVLRGEMSIVGPRPEVEEHTAEYTEEEKEILTVRPGITDFASIRFSDMAAELGPDNPHQVYLTRVRAEKNQLRLEYVHKRSFLVDLKLIGLTAAVVLGKARRGVRGS